MTWKIRCIVAWVFRALCFAVFIFAVPFIAVNAAFESIGDDLTTRVFDSMILGFGTAMLLIAPELLGRLLSWTKPAVRLPRFGDR